MKSKLYKSAWICSTQVPYRAETRPNAALDSTPFTQSIADTFSQMYHYRPHVSYLTQALDDTIHWTAVVWSQEYTSGLEPLIDHAQFQTRAQKVLSEKIFALWGPCKVVKETVYRKTLLRSRGGVHWALAMCIGVGFRLQYL